MPMRWMICLGLAAAGAAAAACNGKAETGQDPRAVVPDFYCPGSESCPDRGEARLFAGASMADITPTIVDTADDLDADGMFEPPPLGEDTWQDNDGDGEWDFLYLAGYDYARTANGVMDPLWARALVLRWKSTTVAIVTLDLVGYFLDDVEDIRQDASDLDIDYIVVHAIHNHEAPDPIGIWGFNEISQGWNEAYINHVREGAVRALQEAYDAMAPARVAYGTAVPDHPTRGICNVVLDGRDPCIVDETLTTVRFIDAADDATIATIVNWGGHPEAAGSENHLVTADYPRWLREGIESGIHRGSINMEGVGGTAIFVDAAGVGIGAPHRLTCEDLEGGIFEPYTDDLGKVRCIGENLAVAALQAIAGESEPSDDCPLAFRVIRPTLVVQNYTYQAMILNDVFRMHRRDLGFDRTRPITDTNVPRLETEVAWLRMGKAEAILLPGEPAPELSIGGYDGSHTPPCVYDWRIMEGTLISEDNPNPPDLSKAPPPPYLFDYLRDLGADFPMMWQTSNDFIGYLIPPYDYQLAEAGAYVEEAPGHHYEETNSIGPDGWPELEKAIIGIMLYRP
jgi:hypothetical protein